MNYLSQKRIVFALLNFIVHKVNETATKYFIGVSVWTQSLITASGAAYGFNWYSKYASPTMQGHPENIN